MTPGNGILFATIFFIIFSYMKLTDNQIDHLDKRITNLELQTKVKHK